MDRRIERGVIHCAATPGDVSAATIDEWHKARGWRSIGYHFVIRFSGMLERGRPIGQTGAHARGYNHDSIGICLAGGLNPGDFQDAQFTTLETVVRLLREMYPHIVFLGHRDLPNVHKACPNFEVKEWLQNIGHPRWFDNSFQ